MCVEVVRDDLANSNTESSRQKCPDSSKPSSLKLLVFAKFPISSSEQKDKA